MYNALTAVIVGVGKEDVPVFRQGIGVNGETVVLTGDEAAICSLVDAGLVVATVTVPERQEEKSLQIVYRISLQSLLSVQITTQIPAGEWEHSLPILALTQSLIKQPLAESQGNKNSLTPVEL